MSAETIDYSRLPPESTLAQPLGTIAAAAALAEAACAAIIIELPPKTVPIRTDRIPAHVVPILTADAQPRIIPIRSPLQAITADTLIIPEPPIRRPRLPAVMPVTPDNFGDVFTIMKPRLERHIQKMISDHPDEVDDLVAETAKRAWEAITPARTIRDTSAWFYRIATNLTTDWLRHRRYANHYEITSAKPQKDAVSVVDRTPSKQDGDWIHDTLHARNTLAYVLGRLSVRDVKLLILFEHEGYSCDEVGQRMGMTRAAVKTALDRARQRARKLARDYQEGTPSRPSRSWAKNRP